MKFVNLNRKLDQNSYKKTPKKRNLKKIFLTTLIVLVIFGIVIYLPVRGVYGSVQKIKTSAKAVAAAAQQENLDEIRKNLSATEKATSQLNGSLNWLFWARFIPYFGGFYADVKHFAKAAEYELEAANTIADSLDPYKAELGFNGTPTPGQDRVAQMVKVLDKVVPQLNTVEPQLKKASDEVASIDTNKYPEKFGKYMVKSQVEAAKNLIQGAHFAVTEARPALEIAPSALGQPNAKNYLMIFQNDKELRATGGFMTAYTFMKIDKGRISASTSDDIYRLDERLLEVCRTRVCPLTPPAALVKYLPEANGKPRTAWSIRDSNLSPDLPTSMDDFERMYNLLPGQEKYDGIVMIDTHVVEDLIKITGPIEVLGTTYSAETDERCNCPNVIYELERYSQVIEKGEADRKAVLGTLMQQLLARVLGASTEKLPQILDVGVKLANSKHIMFYMHDQKTQAALSKLNWTGEIKSFDGDYLHINDSNFAGGKSNLYVEQDVLLEIDSKSGKHNLTINYKNPQAYNTWLNQINRDYIRIYVPKGAILVSSKGSEVKVNTIEDELGKTVFEAFLQVRPQNSVKLELEYNSPVKAEGNEYPLMIQKQPGKKDFNYEIKVDGRSKEKFELETDQTFNISI